MTTLPRGGTQTHFRRCHYDRRGRARNCDGRRGMRRKPAKMAVTMGQIVSWWANGRREEQCRRTSMRRDGQHRPRDLQDTIDAASGSMRPKQKTREKGFFVTKIAGEGPKSTKTKEGGKTKADVKDQAEVKQQGRKKNKRFAIGGVSVPRNSARSHASLSTLAKTPACRFFRSLANPRRST